MATIDPRLKLTPAQTSDFDLLSHARQETLSWQDETQVASQAETGADKVFVNLQALSDPRRETASSSTC